MNLDVLEAARKFFESDDAFGLLVFLSDQRNGIQIPSIIKNPDNEEIEVSLPISFTSFLSMLLEDSIKHRSKGCLSLLVSNQCMFLEEIDSGENGGPIL